MEKMKKPEEERALFQQFLKKKESISMIQSMTGFGRGMYRDEEMNITIEIKAVNNRYAEIQVRSPRRYAFAEEHLRSAVKAHLLRGKIEVSLRVDLFGKSDKRVEVNKAAAEEYYRAYKELAEKLNLPEHQISLSLIGAQEGVLTAVSEEEDEEVFMTKLDAALEEALKDIESMRAAEGARLATDLLHRADVIEGIKDKIKERAPQLEQIYLEKLHARMAELLGDAENISEDRLLLEAAVFADKANITEELVRLESHIAQLRGFLEGKEDTVGKKMDFLIQEMNRETNTIGSKSNDTEITSWMLDLKAEIEKVREQVQNIV